MFELASAVMLGIPIKNEFKIGDRVCIGDAPWPFYLEEMCIDKNMYKLRVPGMTGHTFEVCPSYLRHADVNYE